MTGTKKTIVLPPALGCYVNLFQARMPPNSKPDTEKLFGIVLLWPKSEAKGALKEFHRAALEVAESAWPGKGEEVLRRMRYPVSDDGDERYPENPSFKGMVFVNAKRKEQYGPPGVVDDRVQPVLDQTEAYSGCTFRAQVTLYPFNHPTGGKGVGVGLSNVMVVAKGKRLDGRQEAEEAFADFAEEPADDPDERPPPTQEKEKEEPKGKPARSKRPWE